MSQRLKLNIIDLVKSTKLVLEKNVLNKNSINDYKIRINND